VEELSYIANGNAWLEGATIHFSAMTTFVAIYIAALYAFLRNAPLAVRIIAYTFFVGSFLVFARLGIGFLENGYAAVALGREYAAANEVSDTYRALSAQQWYDAIPVGLLWYLLVSMTVVALGWVTFFFDWKQRGEE